MQPIAALKPSSEPKPHRGAGDAPLHVAVCSDRDTWEQYVNERAGLFHRWDWGTVVNRYGLPVHRLAAYRGTTIVGILPLVEQRSRLFGRHLVSLPWFDAAGVVADDEPEAQALVAAAQELAAGRRFDTIQL
ncbi:MAG: hypothetical protein KF861_20730, partial [Planctomycetaceae bacterium]|nr:hypothetical protein [Planctomycetaceae bacterium]